MLEKLWVVFRIPELRQKIVLTLVLLAVYRLGNYVPLPIIDQDILRQNMQDLQTQQSTLGKTLQVLQLFSAAGLGMSTIFGLGIMPYISASIVFQLLGSVYPPLEKLQKEGETGRKKINEYTRYATVFVAFLQSYFWILNIARGGMGGAPIVFPEFNTGFYLTCAAITMTCGTVFLMWIGEQIDEYGIGNGISLLIMAGILARLPEALKSLLNPAFENGVALGSAAGIDKLLVLAVLFVSVIVAVVAITQGQRRIAMQSAKHVRGRKMFGGQRQFLPLRVNQAGVMPIIFASSLLMFPAFIFGYLASAFRSMNWTAGAEFANSLYAAFGQDRGFIYNICYVALIYFFCYFWTAITFNPKDMANNLKDIGSFIPGYRPGKRTADYLEKVMVRITYVGAAFLAIVAIIPMMVANLLNIDYFVAQFFGGTGLLIAVSVALDLVQKIDSHLVMRNYTGLLEKDNN